MRQLRRPEFPEDYRRVYERAKALSVATGEEWRLCVARAATEAGMDISPP